MPWPFRRFPLVRQHDIMQCGAACLAMICRYYGRNLTLDEAETLCPMSKQGVSMAAIADSAVTLGLNHHALRLTPERLQKMKLPCILYWEQRHFVVLYKISNNRFHIADPGRGYMVYSRKEFLSNWATPTNGNMRGIALLLEPGKDFIKTDSRGKNRPVNPLRVIADYLLQHKRRLWLVTSCLFLGCLMQLVMPFLTQSIVDIGIRDKDINFIWLVLLGELAIVIGRTATDFIRRWLLAHLSIKVNISMLSAFFAKLFRLPMSFFESRQMGDLMQRISDHARVQTFLTEQVLSMIFTTLSCIVFGIVLMIYNTLIFGVFVIGAICYLCWTLLFVRRRRQLDIAMFEKQGANHSLTYELVTTMQETKLQDCCLRRRMAWEDMQVDLFGIKLKSLKLQQAHEAGSIFINEIQNIVITVLSASAVIDRTLSLGAMLAIQYIIGQLNSPMAQIIAFIQSFQDVGLSLERINEVHDRKDEDLEDGQCIDSKNNKGIKVANLNFKYDRFATANILENINIDFQPRKVTAIVGESGSGKTTLIKLMLGYYSNYTGDIMINGTDLRNICLKDWRRKCGVVMQNGVIFTESIARNIAIDDSEIDSERLIKAAKTANIYDFVMSLPLKFETIIGPNGIGVSQGQRQRILIARALYRNPEYIIFDEATNSLDTINERYIVDNLDSFFQNKTVIIIAHRLSTVKNADNIIVMNHGHIAESGTHEQLVSAKGTYYELVKNQLELES
ncbi:peptidase domain-containing ABC transporter [Muribaculum intestinale]|uniref:peptidase domain-containing ABC transporter n=1 Tax=Muribaculum intestinale TaxID=1796646 RepID=UPI0025B6F913|nr:peptidase domain-containing ABC transporter [Muribaculum intestinale]